MARVVDYPKIGGAHLRSRVEGRQVHHVLASLLDRTSTFESAHTGRWLPSLLVRRLERLELACA